MRRREQNSTSQPIMFFMADSTDHISGLTGLTPTVTLSKNAGAFASAAGAVSEVGNGWYALAGDADDRDTEGTLIIHAEAEGADPFDMDIEILASDPPTKEEIDAELSSTHGAGAWGASSTGSSTYPSSDDPFLDNSGNPVKGVSVECYSSSDYSAGSLVQVVETDINGLWEFHLNPGTYYFRAVEEGYDWAVDGGDNEWSDTVT